MLQQLGYLFAFVLSLAAKTTEQAEHGVFFQIKENTFLSYEEESLLWSGKTDSLLSCSVLCGRRTSCRSANFLENRGRCYLLRSKEAACSAAEQLLRRDGYLYVTKVDLPGITDSSRGQTVYSHSDSTLHSVGQSCQTILRKHPTSTSGVYWIDPTGGSQAKTFKAYCDMDTDGGGWTLVWSYSFTNYSHFTDDSNAVTPRPNWPMNSEVDVPISTTPPLNEKDYNAINFLLWKQFGRQVLIKSNINNWLVCHPGTGSLVDWQRGSVNCTIIKYVADHSGSSSAPSKFFPKTKHGPLFCTNGPWNSTYYYFDGYMEKKWPTHDPLGKNKANQVTNVVNPYGNIFIRGE